jgi:tripartite-type tricarboxylate transporter receptor subunit TctC
MTRTTRYMLLLAAASLLGAGSAAAQEYPSRPIRYIVPNTPGVIVDIVARVMAAEMTKTLGQPMVVENKPGGNYVVGFDYVAKQAPADGYTVASVLVPSLAILPVTAKGISFDPLKDLPPVIGLVEGKYVFGSAATQPWKTLAELQAAAKVAPGKLNFGESSPPVYLLAELLLSNLGVQATHIPYSSGGAYLQALIASEVQMGFVGEGSAIGFGEKYRVLAVTGAQRSPAYPQVPTFRELGHTIPGLSLSLNARAGTPKNVTDRLYASAAKALQSPEVRAQFTKMQLEILNQPGDAAAKALADEARMYSEVAAKIGFKPQ